MAQPPPKTFWQRIFSNISIRIIGGLCIVFITLYLNSTSSPHIRQIVSRFDYLVYDLMYQYTLPDEPPELKHKIILVNIDEKSLEAEGHWPWQRHKISQLIRTLHSLGARAIGVDIVFPEAERNPLIVAQETLSQQGIDETAILDTAKDSFASMEEILDGNRALAAAFSDAPVVVGVLLTPDSEVRKGQFPHPIFYTTPPEHAELLDRLTLQKAPGHSANIDVIQDAANYGGTVSFTPDWDGAIRRFPLYWRAANGGVYESLPISLVRLYTGQPVQPNYTFYEESQSYEITGIDVGDDYTIPVTETYARQLVSFRGSQGSFPYVSASDILNGQGDPDTFKGAIVIIGAAAIGLADLRPTPLGIMPGMEVLANITAGLLQPELLYSSPQWVHTFEFFYILSLGIILVFLFAYLPPIPMSIIGISSFNITFFISIYAWVFYRYSIGLNTPLLMVTSMNLYSFVVAYLTESSQRNQIRNIFNQYVPAAHIDEMLNNPEEYTMKGERRELTVLFSDIRSFTSISEKLTAEQLKNMLNRYFTPITKIIFDNQGTIDKYVGDMVMAFWGAPVDDKEHAMHAIKSSILMIQQSDALSDEFIADGLPQVRVGVGINTGEMNVGDMGSQYRKSYTVLGDAVNLGSRLEGLTKFYGVDILVSEQTQSYCPDYEFRFIDNVIVKGKHEAIKIYEPLGLKKEIDAITSVELEEYHQAYQYYLERNWKRAMNTFRDLQRQHPDRPLYQVYQKRIAELVKETLDDSWDGSFEHTSK